MFWGFRGPKYARFSEMWKWIEWRDAIKRKSFHFEWFWGHHPLASLTYLLFYGVLHLLSLTGIFLARIEHDLGPIAAGWYDELLYKKELLNIHENLSFLVTLFIFAHLFAIHWHEKVDHIPVAQSMFNGNQYRIKREVDNESEN